MALKFYNTLTRKKEVFKPLHDKRVGLYTCGPTVHNYSHIGNLRTYIFADILEKTLEYGGYIVKHVMNITDIEDKIIRDSKKSGKSIFEFTKKYEKVFFDDLKKLNIKKAFRYPKATAHIPEMIKIIEMLLKNGMAYKAEGSVYFDISKFKKYGRLSGLKSRELKTGARVNVDEYSKDNAEDFVLWKAAKLGKPSWKASFGKGRPGWHIECSAMSMKYLGNAFDSFGKLRVNGEHIRTIDIHAGGVDLIFPHHENEIAQSEGATGKQFVKYFIEGEHLLVDNKKMSKSLGNFYTLRDIEAKGFDSLAFRYLILTAHYRSKLNFTWESLEAAQNALNNLKNAISMLIDNQPKSYNKISETSVKKFKKEFEKYIYDDLDTPRALALLWEVIKSGKLNPKTKYELIIDFDKVLGLNLADVKTEKIPTEIFKLSKEREKYRKENNFKKADEFRKKLESLGWLIEDTKQGPRIKKI